VGGLKRLEERVQDRLGVWNKVQRDIVELRHLVHHVVDRWTVCHDSLGTLQFKLVHCPHVNGTLHFLPKEVLRDLEWRH